jgi:N-acetyl-anhydromuramyl-L-alanine amidase AmpD
MADTTRLSVTNQQMINAIYKAAKSVGQNGWDLLARAGLTGLIRDRQGLYKGPDIEALSGLTAQEKALVREALDLPAEVPQPETPPPATRLTNQQMINAIYKASAALGKDGWDLLRRAGLISLLRDRQATYEGPAIDELPGLSPAEKAQVKIALGLPAEIAPPGEPTPSGEFTHQQLINAIYKVAKSAGLNGWSLLRAAGLAYLVRDRQASYRGTAIDDLPGISSAQKAQVKAELELPIGVIPPSPPSALRITNQQMINAIYRVARATGQQGWTLLSRARLTHLVRDRTGGYGGPGIDDLPGLSEDEKARLKEILGLPAGEPSEEPPGPPSEEVEIVVSVENQIKWQGPSPNQEPTRYGYPIEMVVMHYTASGSTAGTVSWFMNPDSKVSVHYIVGRDGEIVQVVKDERRAHHAGQGPLSGQSEEVGERRRRRNRVIQPNSRSLGIEMVNWGPLEKRDDKYYTWMGNECPGQVVLKNGTYWQAYTEPQLASVNRLVSYLCKKHNIQAQYPPLGPGAFDSDAETLAAFKGILGHSALDDQKRDPGPHFDWDRLLAGVRESLGQS